MLQGLSRRRAMVVRATLAVGLATAATGPAEARAACGANVLLGLPNSCDARTSITGTINNNLFIVTNTNTGAYANAIRGVAGGGAAAVVGANGGAGPGVLGSGAAGIGVDGAHTATTGVNPGVRGTSASTTAAAAGVLGRLTPAAPGSNSAGVRGRVEGTNGNGSGVFGSHAGSGLGVRGTSVGGTGVFGSHDSVAGALPGVEGETRSTESFAAGVLGEVVPSAPGGFSAGVRGINNGTGSLGIGVWGSQAGGGYGVFGESRDGEGVRGESDSGVGVAAANDGSDPALRASNSGNGPAAAFESAGAPFTVSSSTKVDNLNADQLDGRSANEFGRTAVAAVISYTNGGTFEEQASIIIDAPTDGLMLVSGAVSIGTLVGGDTSCDPCIGVMRLRDKVNDATGAEQVAAFGNGSTEAAAQLSTSWAFPVTAGRRTFALDTHTEGAAGDIYSDNPTLTALFVPFGPSGVLAAGAVTKKTDHRGRR